MGQVLPELAGVLDGQELIRDKDDRPLLRAAIAAGVDVILTGDKDFLSAKIWHPKILTCAEFLSDF